MFRGIDWHVQIGARLPADAVSRSCRSGPPLPGPKPACSPGTQCWVGLRRAAQAGIEERPIMRQTRHHCAATVRRDIHEGQLFDRNVTEVNQALTRAPLQALRRLEIV